MEMYLIHSNQYLTSTYSDSTSFVIDAMLFNTFLMGYCNSELFSIMEFKQLWNKVIEYIYNAIRVISLNDLNLRCFRLTLISLTCSVAASPPRDTIGTLDRRGGIA
jgi:hypothetical protein